MRHLTFDLDLVREETLVVHLAYDPLEPPRPVAFVEGYCESPGCDCRTLTLHAIDLKDDRGLTAIDYVFGPPEAEAQASLAVHTPGEWLAVKLLGVVRTLLQSTDYDERLRARYERNREAGARAAAGVGARPAGAEEVGRNDPCPCGSAKKFKKCCLREHQESTTRIPQRTIFATTDLADAWIARAARVASVDRVFALVSPLERMSQSASEASEACEAALAVLEGLGLGSDREGFVAISAQVDSAAELARRMLARLAPDFEEARPLVELMLPVLLDPLLDAWAPGLLRPRHLARRIEEGWAAWRVGRIHHSFATWSRTWAELDAWMEGSRAGDPLDPQAPLEALDDLLDEDCVEWLEALMENAVELVADTGEDQRSEEDAPSCAELLASIRRRFTPSYIPLANRAAARCYVALLRLERPEEASAELRELHARPTNDLFAALFLGDACLSSGLQPTPPDLELAIDFAERTLELADGFGHEQLDDMLDELKALA